MPLDAASSTNLEILTNPAFAFTDNVFGSFVSSGSCTRSSSCSEISSFSHVWDRMAYLGMSSPMNSSSTPVFVLISRIPAWGQRAGLLVWNGEIKSLLLTDWMLIDHTHNFPESVEQSMGEAGLSCVVG